MPIIKKFKQGVYEHSNLFKIKNPTVNVGDNEVKEITPFRGVIQQQGDVITAEEHNEIQKNGTVFVTVEYSENYGSGVDGYVIKNFINEQGLFEGLKLKFKIPRTNIYENPVIVLGTQTYNLKIVSGNSLINVRKGELNINEIVNIIYCNGSFILENQIASENSRGITKYGTESGTALEGKRLTEIMGLEFGGNIQDIGTKITGKFYYDKSIKHYFECTNNNDLTYVDVTKFKPISNKPISDRLENLSSFKREEIVLTSTDGQIAKFNFVASGNVRIVWVINIGIKNQYQTTFPNLPEWFCKNAETTWSVLGNGTGGIGMDTAEFYLDIENRSIKIFPQLTNTNIIHQLTGQCITVARI
ncbi:hypothetical protein EII29_08350 [Leptotrichia sp. OH3620_COT-345]|uniref:hypothetical protein n=1 Tax=Leptotrichia sp. OH3620_COT-345 TaxID=2491048 RepID=UPI000F64CFA8|nr:hypothetical protein [Leptotrichia sp. OH3620_COT-345]RRD39116.1 hypothetical protein EII29_08350 [Leptotrichia sp. OH3620_COT-345]